MNRGVILSLLVLGALALPAMADEDGEFSYGETPLPRAVLDKAGCADRVLPYASRRPFDGGYVFAARCLGDAAAFVEVLVQAADTEGRDARLLLSTEVTYLAVDALPGPVAEVSACREDGHDRATRRPFADGIVFAIQCAGNHANTIEELIWARDADGKDARVLNFPSPDRRYGDEPATSLSNIRWRAESSEVREIAVDQEEEICRSEGIWRLKGDPPEAENIFWRQTTDCEGAGGWLVVVDKRAEKAGN